ncbi:MAG: ATP-binding protein [Gillisia sp.]
MQKNRIIITGGPGTGKSSVIKHLEALGFACMHEVSREITLQAQKEGIEQLFLKDPVLFSRKLMEARIQQHQEVKNIDSPTVFLDRGLPDVIAYMDYFGTSYPSVFPDSCKNFTYDHVFILPPWKEIYLTDNERYENFEQAEEIQNYLEKTYLTYGYSPLEVPKDTIERRTEFILNHLSL